MANTALFVFHPDRGHFNFCLPLAKRLAAQGVRCELWTNTACLPWTPEGYFDNVRTDFGESNLQNVVGEYKAIVSHGDTDADGQRHLIVDKIAEFGAIFGQLVPESEGEPHASGTPVSKKGVEAFKKRLSDSDVGCVIFEAVWGKWARDISLELGKKSHGLMPSYRCPFRAAYCSDPILAFDGQCIVRNRPEDLDDFYGLPAEDVSYIIADCLVGKATECGGRHRFGAFLPNESITLEDATLQEWLDGAHLPEEQRTLTLIALGSQSSLTSLSSSAVTDLLSGVLEASPRALLAGQDLPDDVSLMDAVKLGKLKSTAYVPQWAVLNHRSVRCFVFHGGANSAHEALAAGTAVVPLPFFDDQFYIAERVEELFGYPAAAVAASEAEYAPLRKATLRTGGVAAVRQVAAAVRLGLAVPEATLKSVQESVIGQDGVGAAAKTIASHMALA